MALVLVGAGGHGKVVADAARAAGVPIAGFVDDRYGIDLDRLPTLGTIDEYKRAENNDDDAFIVAIGDNWTRMNVYDDLVEAGQHAGTVIHPTATVSEEATIEDGAYIGAEAVVNPGAFVGENAIVNTRATVEHDCVVGAHAFVAPHAVMCGESKLGEGALLGANATLAVGKSIGEWTKVGEGAVVKENLPAHVTAVGVPAKVRDQR
jgi:sugar O-acyltransferase (sialic acid O-acetyltransferase NeuD family)